MATFSGLDSVLANIEGFNVPGSVAARNNNPGNITYGSVAVQNGATGFEQVGPYKFATFPTVAMGTQAEDANIQSYLQTDPTITLAGLVNKWSPATAPGNTPASTQSYLDSILKSYPGATANTPISSLASNPTASTLQPSTGLYGQALNPTSPAGILAQAFGCSTAYCLGGSPLGPSTGPGTGGGTSSSNFLGFSLARAGAFFLGLICIAGGIYLFKDSPVAVSV